MRRLALALLATAAFTQVASAADLPAKGPVYTKAPALVAAAYDWTGGYVGIAAGIASGRTSWGNGVPALDTGTFSATGGIIGGTLGWNFQSGAIVFGLEGDWSWANPKPTTILGGCAGLPCASQLDWLATARGRLGWAVSQSVLLYLTGGGAWGSIHHTIVASDRKTTGSGWTWGGGVEAMITPQWSVKAEYLNVNLGDTVACTAPVCAPNVIASKYRVDIFRAGLNFHF